MLPVVKVCIKAITRMFPEGKKKKKAKDDIDASDEFDEPVDVLVDTIIGFLETSTAYLKTTANKVFSLLSGSVKESTVDLILTVSLAECGVYIGL
jgi:DNA polymerase phi